MHEETALILPGEHVASRASLESLSGEGVVWLRNPVTGVIHKFRHGSAAKPLDDDTIARCLKDGFTLSTEAAARTQAIELARLQGRILPEEFLAAAAVEKPAKATEKSAR